MNPNPLIKSKSDDGNITSYTATYIRNVGRIEYSIYLDIPFGYDILAYIRSEIADRHMNNILSDYPKDGITLNDFDISKAVECLKTLSDNIDLSCINITSYTDFRYHIIPFDELECLYTITSIEESDICKGCRYNKNGLRYHRGTHGCMNLHST